MADLGTLGSLNSFSYDINAAGQVVGFSGPPLPNIDAHAFRYSGLPGSGGFMADLGTLGGRNSHGYGINEAGQVTGDSDVTGVSPSHAFRYTGTPGSGGTMVDLGTLGGSNSSGNAINAAGQVAGFSDITGNAAHHAFLYTGNPGSGGAMADLGTLGGTYSAAFDLNDSGQVAGNSQTEGDASTHAFLYSGVPGSGGVMHALGTLGGDASFGYAINSLGQVAGTSYLEGNDFVLHAFLYIGAPGVGGQMIDLDAWLDVANPVEGAKWTLKSVGGLTDGGLATGEGFYDDGPGGLSDGMRAFVLDASEASNADFDEDGDVDGADLTRWRTNFVTGATHLQGNADGDGDVDGADFLAWQRQAGSPGDVVATGAVPEPGSMALAAFLLGGVMMVRRTATTSGNRRITVRASLALAAALAFSAPLSAQTWTGAAGNNWNNAANWANPSQVPNSATADVIFAPSAVNAVSIPAVFQVRSLTFASGTNSYTLSPLLVPGDKKLTSLQTITVAENVTTTQQINLGGDANGSLLFIGDGDPAALTIANHAVATAVGSPTLLIGPFTSIGTPDLAGITVNGTGTTTLSGSFASSGGNEVVGGLTKTGPGTLTLSGNGNNLFGDLTLAGGTLRLDYSTNTASKLGGGGLRSSGGDLLLVPHASTSITQNLEITALTAGHTEFNVPQVGAPIALGFGAITRSAGATVNFSAVGNFSGTTSTGNTNGLLGAGAAFATASGQYFSRAAGGGIGVVIGQANTIGAGVNTDIVTNVGFGGTTNSLRFTNDALTLNLLGTLTIQSGGILLPSTVSTATITGGTLEGVIAHVYGSDLTIGSQIIAANGITKTGPGTLTLAGDNVDLNGPVNVNRGHLRVTNLYAIDSLDAINFNDARTGSGLQRFTVDIGSNTSVTTNAAIRLSAYSSPGAFEANIFSTGTSQNTRVTLGGVIASAFGTVTPLRFLGDFDDTSGFNLTGANTFTGAVRLEEGTLGINSNASLGDPGNALFLNTSSVTAGGLEFLNADIDVARPVAIISDTRVVSNEADVSTISGPVTGDGTLVKAGTGVLVLTNAGNAGDRDIRVGTLRVAAGALGATGDLFLGDGATLAVAGNNTFDDPRVLVLGSVPGPATATVDVAANQTFTAAGLVENNTGSFGALIKTGAGALALTGLANTYTGGTVVRAGAVQAAADGSLGAAPAPVAVEVGGRLMYTGATITGRTFTMPGGALEAAAGATVTLDGATVNGGFLRGTGAFDLTGGTALTGVTTFTSTAINQSGQASVANFTNGGSFTVGADQTLVWNGGTNTSSGRMVFDGTANVSDFVSDGQVNIPSGGVLNNSGSPLVLGGGSRTFVGSAAAPGGAINLAGQTLELNGALLVNNGTITGATNVNFGSLAMGAGSYGAVNVFNGGAFSPGNSPGAASLAAASFNAGGIYVFELADADAGIGFDFLNIAGALSITAGTTSNSKFTLEIVSLDAADQPGLVGNFDPTHSYNFVLATADGGITGFAPNKFKLDISAFENSLAGGQFSLAQSGNDLLLTFSPGFLAADFDEDHDVDGDDLTNWKGGFGSSGLATHMQGDADGDQDVDGGDFLVWQRQLGSSPAIAATGIVPEPGAMVLIVVALTGFSAHYRPKASITR
jgi:autotransporter-associated beta strand protein/probable HAF family extracellular repeat protein